MRNKSQAIRNRLAVRRNLEGQTSRRSENIYARLRRILFKPKLLALPLLALALGTWNAPLFADSEERTFPPYVEPGITEEIQTGAYNNIVIINGMLIVDRPSEDGTLLEGLTVSDSTGVYWIPFEEIEESGKKVNVAVPYRYYDDPDDPYDFYVTQDDDGKDVEHITYYTGALALGDGSHVLNGVTRGNSTIALYGSDKGDGVYTNKTEINGEILAGNFLIGDNVNAIINGDITIDSGTLIQAKVKEVVETIKDENGVTIKDEDGNDETRKLIIPDLDNWDYALDDQGNRIPAKDENGNPLYVLERTEEYYYKYSTNNSVTYNGDIKVQNFGLFFSNGDFNGSITVNDGTFIASGNFYGDTITVSGRIPEENNVYMELNQGSVIGDGSGITLDVNNTGYLRPDYVSIIGFLATDIKEYNKATITFKNSYAMFQNTQEKSDVLDLLQKNKDYIEAEKKFYSSGKEADFNTYNTSTEKRREAIEGVKGRKTVYNDSTITITDRSIVYANVTSINTKVTIDSGSTLCIINGLVGQNDKISKEGSSSDAGSLVPGASNIVTYDEDGNRTILIQNDTRNRMGVLYEAGYCLDQVNSLSGSGDIFITSSGDESGYNELTYVALNNNNNDFSGNLQVETGVLHIKGNVTLGRKKENPNNGSNFILEGVKSKALAKEDDGKIPYEFESGSLLYFDRNSDTDPNAAPTLTFNSVFFEDGWKMVYIDPEKNKDEYIYGGSTLFFDTRMATNEVDKNEYVLDKDRKLATINADSITFGEKTNIWYDLVSMLDTNATMTIELNAEKVSVKTQRTFTEVAENSFNEEVKETQITKDNLGELNEVFEKVLITANSTEKKENDTNVGYTVSLNVKNIVDFAEDQGMSVEEKNFAAEMDESRKQYQDTDRPVALYDALYNSKDAAKVKQTIRNLARSWGLDNALDSTAQIGSAGSAFFSGLTAGGVVTRYQSRFDNEDQEATSALDSVKNENANTTSQATSSSSPKNRSLWGTFSYTTVESDQYEKGGITYDSFKTKRSGVLTGLKRQFDDTMSGGILFSYTKPESTQRGDYAGWNSGYQTKIDMDDFQFALHLEKVIGDAWEISLFAGGGAQTLDWERTVTDGVNPFNFKGDSTGNTVTATAYLARRIDLSEHFIIRPTIGIDSEHSWLFGFEEEELARGDYNATDNMIVATQKYAYDTIQYSRNSARIGMTTTWSGPRERGGLVGRVFYGVQLGGDDAAFITMKSIGQVRQDWQVTQEGHSMGGESLNLGMGGYLFLNKEKTLTLNGDYNALMYKNATSQNATGTVSYRF